MFEEVFPTYLLYGMTADEFWNSPPFLVKGYREKHRLEVEQINQELWLQGFYIYEAFSVVMQNSFRKNGAKKAEYPKEPHRITPLKDYEKEQQKQKQIDDFRNALLALDRKFAKKKQMEQGGG